MAAIETNATDKSLDVRLNIVPFIDLMSCLTAFLLVTAAWTGMSKIDVEPRGLARDGKEIDYTELVRASVLIEEDAIWLGLSRLNDFRKFERGPGGYDLAALGDALREVKRASYFIGRDDIEIAAADRIPYETLIAAMDTAIASGFEDVGVTEPMSLSARPAL